MNINAVISPNPFKGKSFSFKENKILIVNFAVLTVGLIAGSVLYVLCKSFLTGELWTYFVNFTTVFSSKSKIEIISGLLLSNIPYVFMMILFGASAIGLPFIYGLSFIKIMGLSMIVSHIYFSYGLKGIEYSLLIFFPGKLLLIFSMIILMGICANSSIKLYKASTTQNSQGFNIGSYILKTAVTISFYITSSLIDFIAISCFSSLFSFS